MNIFQKPQLKYLIILVLLVSVVIGGYYLYGYYKYQFVDPVVVLVKFKPGVTEEEALKMLEKYVSGISTRTPRDYDNQSFNFYEGFKGRVIQFTVKGMYRKSIKEQIKQEPIVQF